MDTDEQIEQRVRAACTAAGHNGCYVDYAAYPTDKDDEPIDNLDATAYTGKLVVITREDNFFGGPWSKAYRSDVLTNPTWLQLTVCANASIIATNDKHHCFFEGFTRIRTEGDVLVAYLVMGS